MFKKILFACLVVLPLTLFSTSAASVTSTFAKKLFNTLRPAVMSSPAVSGIDIGGCDAAGAPDSSGPEDCVRIFSHTSEGVAAFKVIYPQGVKINGAYISVQYMPISEPQ